MYQNMTRGELLALHQETCDSAREIMQRKNQDYSSGDNCFTNFTSSEIYGVPAELAILVRCSDKFQRIKAFVQNGELAVKEESAEDSIQDVINYMILLKGLITERRDNNVYSRAKPCENSDSQPTQKSDGENAFPTPR